MKDKKMSSQRMVKTLGRFIVADPRVCHGQPTFRGTRIFVADVLEQVGRGLDWEAIIEEWDGSITSEAIAEAVHLASQALLKHAGEFALVSTAP
ncbi:MAG: DUF433 domain-containing protein [Candidatus Sumerlaeota bacterium]|nr:DUF433 domain-containing protein [Candidatus Sumerlaeota bacterium]